MTANSLFALASPFQSYFNAQKLPYIIYGYFLYFFQWFGMMVLVKTMCELTDILVPRELSLRIEERYTTYRESNSICYSEIQRSYSSDLKAALGDLANVSVLTADENSIYDHFLGRKASWSQL